ncbi:TipAS antibiotic-recognition domain-containing protein [Actinomadura logoneensis]|uniref:TipAS antibiotic-recognition domain-containing protein n=1 Tax=Actinomadura logoneensis TaxID=2293572 RepID=UPI002E2635AC
MCATRSRPCGRGGTADGRHAGGVQRPLQGRGDLTLGRARVPSEDDWWHGKSCDQQRAWKQATEDLVAAWVAAVKAGVSPTSERAQSLAARHVQWLSQIPGTPTADGDRERSIEMVKGLGDLYVNDPRFAGMYDDAAGAMFVRDALREYARTRM